MAGFDGFKKLSIATQLMRFCQNVAIFTRVLAIESAIICSTSRSNESDRIEPDLTTRSTMKKIAIQISRGVTNVMVLGMASTGIVLASAPARAASFSFAGNLNGVNDTPSFFLVADGSSTVNIQSSSYAAGGFDPILTLFDGNDNFFLEREDIAQPNLLDFQLIQVLPAGNYRAVISAFANFANGTNFNSGFGGGGDFFGRTPAYALTIQGVTQANAVAIPEPASLIGTLVGGFAIARLKRKLAVRK